MITFSKLGQYGQLGNQLFQYALLRAVAARNGYEVGVPRRFMGAKGRDLVELAPFAITAPGLPADFRPRARFTETSHRYDPAVFDQPDGTDFFGFFQSEKYFKPIEGQLRNELRLPAVMVQTAATWVRESLSSDGTALACAVHVRRGDYLRYPRMLRALSPAWYRRACGVVASALGSREISWLVFSDDVPWCVQHLQGPRTHFSILPDHYHDLAAMALCQAHVISPSSFGWWGAWLARSTCVVTPTPWFAPGSGLDARDLVPEPWARLPD